MEIVIASSVGFCEGVERAISMLDNVLQKNKKIYMLGDIIHNKGVIEYYKNKGVMIVDHLPDDEGAVVITRSHGIIPSIIQQAKEKGLILIDTTCPYVKRVQEIASHLERNGYDIIIVGDSGHDEVRAIISRLNKNPIVVSNKKDVDKIFKFERIGIISQTTQSTKFFSYVVGKCATKFSELRVFNTICEETVKRQREVNMLSKLFDVVVVIGGKNSANTKRLYNIARKNCNRVFWIEKETEIEQKTLYKKDKILLVSGASTPYKVIEKTKNRLEEIDKLL